MRTWIRITENKQILCDFGFIPQNDVPCFLYVNDKKCRIKKEIANYLRDCNNIIELIDYLQQFGLELNYEYGCNRYKVFEITRILKKNRTTSHKIKFDLI